MKSTYFKCGEGIGCNVECGDFDIFEEVIELITVEEDASEILRATTLTQHVTTVKGNFWVLIPIKRE